MPVPRSKEGGNDGPLSCSSAPTMPPNCGNYLPPSEMKQRRFTKFESLKEDCCKTYRQPTTTAGSNNCIFCWKRNSPSLDIQTSLVRLPSVTPPFTPTEIIASPPLGFLSPALPSTLGFFSEGWAVSYLLATVITGLLILGFWLMPVSRPEQVARQCQSSRLITEAELSAGSPAWSIASGMAVLVFPWGRSLSWLGLDGNHLRHGGKGHFAGAGDV